MNKTEFVLALAERLPFMPRDEIEERAAFYFEIVDDLMEEGLSEEEAFAQIDSIDSIVEQMNVCIMWAMKAVRESTKRHSSRGTMAKGTMNTLPVCACTIAPTMMQKMVMSRNISMNLFNCLR